MQSEKRKTKEDTWKSDELRKHLGSLEPGFQPEDKYRERRKHRDGEANGNVDSKERRHRDRDKERKTEKYKDREREKYRQTDRDKDQRKDGHKERYREKESDSDKGKDTEKHRDRDQVRDRDKNRDRNREKDKHRERERDKDRHRSRGGDEDKEIDFSKEPHRNRTQETDQRTEMEDEDRERRRQERRDKKKGDQENTGSHRKLSRSRDEDNEQRHREHRDREQSLHNDRARRQQEKKDLENEERGRKHRERGDSLREFSERKHGDSKEQTRESTDKDRERRHRERIDLEDDERQRRHRERRERKERKEKKEDYENSYHKRSEVNLKEEEGGTNSVYQRNTEKQFGKNKSEVKLTEEPAPNQLRSTWRSSQRQLSDEENAGEEIVGEKTAIPEVQEETMTYSEEGFEDYDDDFEVDNSDDDGHGEDEGLLNKEKEEPNEVYSYRKAEVEEVQKAIIAENERIGLMQSQSSQRIYKNESKRDLRVTSGKGSQCGTFIDFVTAKQRQISQKAVRKQKKRSAELLRLIDLDFSVSFTLLDLPPVNEYDMYIKSFGRTNTKQAYVQCNEDNIDRDVQTEEIETVEKWTQHPGESAIVCGGLSNSDALSVDSQSMLNVDSQRLTTFLRSASQVVAVLLEEDQAEKQSQRSLRSEATSLSIADGCFQLNTNLSFLQNREVDCLNFSQVQRQMFLSVHGFPKTNSAVRLDSKYIICVWNIWEPSSPQKVLVCESKIQCCCFSPGKATLVFAGTVDGSVVLWDLREPGNLHHCMKIGAQDWTFRNPTFSTDAILAAVSHSCPVQAVEPVSSIISEGQRYSSSPLAPQEEMSGLSFQIASLDEEGLLNLWVASELPKADLAGSRTDLGLIPGGKVKLLHSSAININSSFFPRDIIQLAPPQMLNIRFLPCDPNHFIVGTDMVGCSDGSIRVHEMNTEYPTMQWRDSTDGQPIIAMQWSLTRPAVFFVLDAVSTIHVWDLLENDLQPVSKECVQTDGVTMMAVLGEPEKPSALSCLVLAKQSGTIEVQCIKNKWAISQREELEKLHYVLHNIA
nr:PREDICTED: WD repeat-containing protein 60 [Latimeria chalumnae]|eukprot:XP_014353297.1 PREDICTED: WD repeat-containing protein 60 [Latimeria chalumnae]